MPFYSQFIWAVAILETSTPITIHFYPTAGKPIVDAAGRLSQDEFIVLLSRNERRVRAFVSTLVRQQQDLDEIVQQSCLAAWKKLDQFVRIEESLDSDFSRWLCTIARYETLDFVKRNRRSTMLYDTELVCKLADIQLQDEQLDDRREALAECIRKLPASRQNLLRRYYRGEESAALIAKQDGVSRQAIFSRLRVIRNALLNCINQSLANCGVIDG